jgi:hypothetical protein
MDSLYDQTAPDDETLVDSYTIEGEAWDSMNYVVFGPGIGRRVASGGWHEVLAAIREDMDREQYWPDAYYINDHGNISLLSVTTGEEVASWV